MPSTASIPLSCALAMFIADVSVAQSAFEPRSPGTPPMLQRVDQAHADVSALSDSLREVNMAVDFRDPIGFQYVYRVPGRKDLVMRASGGIYAIFPQSEYIRTERGLTPVVPAGTVYAIGIPSPRSLPMTGLTGPTLQNLDIASSMLTPLAPNEQRDMVFNELSNRTTPRRDSEVLADEWNSAGAPNLNPQDELTGPRQYQIARATPPDPSTFLKTVVTDDAVRNQRLTELMQKALEAVRSNGG